MSLLSKIFPPRTPMPAVRIDPTLGEPGARSALGFARRGDWRSLRGLLANEKDVSARARYVALAADVDKSETWIGQWLDEENENADAWFLSARRTLNRASDIRGSAKAKDVPEERWDPFHQLVVDAEEEAMKAAELRPDDPLPWVLHLSTGMILGDTLEDRLVTLGEATKRAPHYHGIFTVAAHAFAEKWGGSHELMFKVTRQAVAAAPSGTAVPLGIALAHVERWLYYIHWEENPKAAENYFKVPSVNQELRAAHEKCQGLSGALALQVANTFAFCFSKGGQQKAARAEFAKAGGILDDGFPWCYGGIEAYKRALGACW